MKNVAASVRARLSNLARETSDRFWALRRMRSTGLPPIIGNSSRKLHPSFSATSFAGMTPTSAAATEHRQTWEFLGLLPCLGVFGGTTSVSSGFLAIDGGALVRGASRRRRSTSFYGVSRGADEPVCFGETWQRDDASLLGRNL